ncbi:hypothetical protein ACFL2Q_06665 [Thermodesulfobacteriota bacterium]
MFRIRLYLCFVIVCLVVTSVSVWGADGKRTITRKMKYMMHDVTIRATIKADRISGVARIVVPFSRKKLRYHFKGRIRGNRIVARHHQGHVFRGRLFPNGGVKGVLRTRKGVKVPISVPPR